MRECLDYCLLDSAGPGRKLALREGFGFGSACNVSNQAVRRGEPPLVVAVQECSVFLHSVQTCSAWD